jgi:succinate dehydrogenase flavin-adding protein (antitoxin of CptAB toxin-antitoxin module)
MRQLWSVIESTQSNTLLKLDDASLVQWLLKQTKTKASLDHNEIHILSDYIHSRLTLIRDLAQERQSSWQPN